MRTHAALFLLWLTAISTVVFAEAKTAEAPTWAGDVAPILFAHCAPCHRPEQVAPFSLLDYADARRRAPQIARVTAARYMPPWKPEPGHGRFRGERRLSTAQIGTLARWAEAGAPRGDLTIAPTPPRFASGWRLGEPDRVVTMAEPYRLAASGPDVFRNFLLPVGATEARHVEAVELRSGNPRIVHHATILLDTGGAGRRLDDADPEPGFEEMVWSGEIAPPDGHFLAWTPGRVPRRLREGMAWSLPRSSDLVLEAHLLPSGKDELLEAQIGLYFTDSPPTERPVLVRMGNESLDISAGAVGYRARDRFTLPVAVDALSIYPHAHYLGREVKASAVLPDGRREPLIWIRDWDFNWQDRYEYETPVPLPMGTILELEIVYDNSEANVANPHQPPQRVLYGPRSQDEMANLWLQVLPRWAAERPALERAVREHYEGVQMDGLEARVARGEEDFATRTDLAGRLARRGDLAGAARHYRRAVELEPTSVPAHNNLALVLARSNELDEAIRHYREALRHLAVGAAESVPVRINLASALLLTGNPGEAEALAREALARDPESTDARLVLGDSLARLGQLEGAVTVYRALLARQPSAAAHNNLATALAGLGQLEEAAEQLRQALRLDPKHADARRNLEAVLARLGS